MESTPTISVLVVNHNGRRFLADCLGSLRRKFSRNHEVLLLDNASTDGSVEFVRAEFPEVRVLSSAENLGFTAANNCVAAEARGEHLLLLNPDTVLLDDPYPAVDLLDADPGVGVVGLRMVGPDGDYRPSAGHFPRPSRLIRIRSMYLRRGPFADGEFPTQPACYTVDWIEGSFLLTRRALWEQVGGLDEDYFMYVEDVDYCRKARDAGFRTVYLPAASYVHFGGFDIGRMAWTVDGFRRYHRKHSGRAERLVARVVLSLGLLARSAVSAVGWGLTRRAEYAAKMRVCWQAFRGVPPGAAAAPAGGGPDR